MWGRELLHIWQCFKIFFRQPRKARFGGVQPGCVHFLKLGNVVRELDGGTWAAD